MIDKSNILFSTLKYKLFLLAFCIYNSTFSQNVYKEKEGFYYLGKAKNTSKAKKDSIFYYLNKSRAIGLKHNLDSLLLKTTATSVQQYFRFRKYNIAYKFCLQLDSLAKKQNDSYALYYAAHTLGRLESRFDNSHKSTEYYKKALAIAIKRNDSLSIIYTYNNISNNYTYLEQYKQALPFQLECLRYFQKLPIKLKKENRQNLAMLYVNLVYTYTELKERQKAFLYLEKAEEMLKNNYSEGYVELNQLKGHTYAGFYEYKKAINEFKKQLKISKQRKDKIATEHVLLNLAELHVKIKDFKNATLFFNAYEDSNNIDVGDNEILSDNKQIYIIGMNTYKGAKNYEKAFKYAELLNQTLDTLHKIEVNKTFAEYGVKYETEKKEQENTLLQKENVIKDLEVKKQTANRNYLLLLSALGLITLGITYNRYRLKRKTANVLTKQNEIISNQKVELEKSNSNKQRLFGIIAHDLVNPFNAILGYTQLLEDDYESFNDKERKEFIVTINKYANSNYSLTRTLLDWAKVQQDRLIVNKSILNCKEIVESALQPYQVLADKKEIKVSTNIVDTITIEADKNMMQTVIGNLFVNAIKFTPQKGEISLKLDKNNDGTINIEIADNGIGMSQEQLNNLFDITKVNTRKGTSNEKGNGLGLILCKELMELQKGTLQLFSKRDIGSRAVLTI